MAKAIDDAAPDPEAAKRRWPPDGFYDGKPCTCPVTCGDACKGECGCEACRTAYADFLSVE